MSTKKTPQPGKPDQPQAVETEVGTDSSFGIDMGQGSGPGEAEGGEAQGHEVELGADGGEEPGEGDGGDGDGEQGEDAKDKDDDGKEADEKEEGAEDLGEFDPKNEEVVTKFDSRYMAEDGTLNEDALSAEWWKNAGDDPEKGGLNEATYAYLQNRFGIAKKTVKKIEAAQMAQRQVLENRLYERAGGKDKLTEALEWGKKGGYTEAQRERFNKIMKSGDLDAVDDAVDALVARHAKAASNRPPGGRRPLRPQRTVASDAEAPREEGFKDRDEYRKALREAGNNMSKVNAVNSKLRASPWWKRGAAE